MWEIKHYCCQMMKLSTTKILMWWSSRWCLWNMACLTHWGRDKMAAVFQTTFSIAFSWIKMYVFRLKFHWSLFLRVQLTWSSIGSDNGLAPSRLQAIIWTNGGYFTDAYICVARPQWVNSSPPSASFIPQWIGSALVQIMACCLFVVNAGLSSIRPLGTNFSEI